MPVAELTVSLSEVLEFRGAPLTEVDLWAVLHQSVQALQDLFIRGEGLLGDGQNFVISPDSLSFNGVGQIEFTPVSLTNQDVPYIAPEVYQCPVTSGLGMEKACIYSLGRSLLYAAGSQHKSISRNLDSVFDVMCDKDANTRVELIHVLEACTLYAEKHPNIKPYSHYIINLYKSILGGGSEEENVPENLRNRSQRSRHENSYAKENRSNRSRGKHKYKNDRHRSRSDSRSRSHSRSRSRSRTRRHSDKDDADSGYPLSSRDNGHHHNKQHNGTTNGFSSNHDHHYYGYQGQIEPPDYHLTHHNLANKTSPVERSYHLSDITFSSQLNENTKVKNASENISSHHSGVQINRKQARSVSQQSIGSNMGNTAYEKYLKLKNRQRKLRVLRRGLLDENGGDDSPITLTEEMDQFDTRSMVSMQSVTQGTYMPAVHMQYGSEMALRMGRESDRESVVSSEVSLYQPEHNAMRSTDHHHHHHHQQHPDKDTAKLKSKPLHADATTKKSKEFYGPEFVHKASKSIIKIPIPLQGESLKNPSHARRVVVIMLTGQKLELMCDPSTTGQQLFEAVVTHIELPEFFFFGLTYVADGEHCFIDPEMKLHKVAPEGWKEGWKGHLPTITFTVYLRLKFYPEHIGILRHKVSRRLLYLQLRHDVLEERTLCSEEKYVTLAGLALQAEYGDYDKETMGRNYYMPEHYYPSRMIKGVGTSYIRDKTADSHQEFSGLSENLAQIEFIKMAQQLQEYGVHFYKLMKSKNDASNMVWIGITVRCLTVAENQTGHRVIVQKYPWHMTQKISFNKRRFSIQPKPDYGQGKPVKINYYTNSYRKGRYLLQFCTAQHRFQLKMKSREAQLDSQDLTMDTVSGVDLESADMEEIEDAEMDGHSRQDSSGSASGDDHHYVYNNTKDIHTPMPYMLPPPYKPDTSVSLVDLRQRYTLPSAKRRSQMMHAATTGDLVEDIRFETSDAAYVIEMSTRSQERAPSPPTSETINATLQSRFDKDLLSPELPERDLYEVVLVKEPRSGIGLTIVGGENAGKLDLGIFIKSVTSGGAAERNGKIKPGDRLVAINDKNLEGLQHHDAVRMIRDSEIEVKLLISQIRPPGSIRRRDYDEVIIPTKLRGSYASPSDVNIYKDSHPSFSEPDIQIVVENADKSNIPQKDINGRINDSYLSDGIHGDITVTEDKCERSEVNSVQRDMVAEENSRHKQNQGDDSDTGIMSATDSNYEESVVSKLTEPATKSDDIRYEMQPERPDSCRSVDSLPGEVYDVLLLKKDGSFGLNVTGGVNTSVRHGGIYIKSLTPGGAAELEGSIRKGDRILEVNDVSLRGATHKRAVEFLCNAPSVCKLVLERGKLMSRIGSKNTPRSSPAIMTSSKTPDTGVVKSPEKKLSDTQEDIVIPEIKKELESAVLSAKVKDVMGDVDDHDEIESVDNSDSEDLQKIGQKYYPFVTPGNTYEVDLKKGNSGLGFSVHGGSDVGTDDPYSDVVRIKKVFPIGPAAESGQIQSGDVILEVNSKQVKGLTHTETMATLRTASSYVNLLMCRPNPDILPPMKSFDSQESIEAVPAAVQNVQSMTPTYETESEDEPVLYRDSLITPPSAFASPGSTLNPESDPSDQASESPPPLPVSPPPPAYYIEEPQAYEEGDIVEAEISTKVNDLHIVLPIENEDNSEQHIIKKEDENVGETRERLGSSQSDESGSSHDSVIRSPLKDMNSTASTYPESELSMFDKTGACTQNSTSQEDSGTSEFELTDVHVPDVDIRHNTESPSLSPLHQDDEEFDGFLKTGEVEVTLQNEDENGLGILLCGGSSTTGGCYIKGIVDDPALSDGRLKTGDKLIKVNGVDITELNYQETEEYLRHAPHMVTLRVLRDLELVNSLSESNEKSGNDTVSTENTGEYNNDIGSFSQGENIEETEEPFTDIGNSSNLDENVSESDRESPSEELMKREILQDVQVVPQYTNDEDIVTELVGGHYLDIPCGENESDDDKSEVSDEVDEGQSLERDRETGGDEISTLNESGVSFLSSLFSLEGGVVKINLEKPVTGDLGFSLVTAEKDNQTGIFVKNITQTGVAASDGRLQVMDRIIQINGESLVGLNHTKAVAILKKAPKDVTLTVSRLSSRQLDLMTPPIIMDDDVHHGYDVSDDDKDEFVDEGTIGRPGTPDENVVDDFDSDDEKDMTALVIEAEKLLAANETIELPQEQIRDFLRTTSPPTEQNKDHNVDEKENNDVDDNKITPEPEVLKKSTSDNEELERGDNTESSVDGNCTGSGVGKTFTIVSSPRNLDMTIPDDMTPDWLFSLPLVTILDEHRSSIPNLIDHLQNKIEMDDPVEEYKELRLVKPTDNCDVAKRAENKSRNRFRNVLPYDINRVELSGASDYINASHIITNIGESECHYIASQGPLPNTSADFWKMVWEQEVDIIAMLTLDMEAKKVKCHRYWPESTESPLFVCENQFRVSLVSHQSMDDFDIREIEIEDVTSEKKRLVHHYNYTTWPDHGVPSSAVPLLQSMQLMHIQHRTGPIVVHCSAGIGRTGAFITIDVALAHIEHNGQCDIFEIVKELRKQRQGMIQTKDQYLFCYCACIEALLSSTMDPEN